MDFKEIVEKRYATKRFDTKKILQKDIDSLMHLIRMSASSFGLQPWKVIVVSDQSVKQSLEKASFNQTQIISSSHLLVFCADTDVKHHIDLYEEEMVKQGITREIIQKATQSMRNFDDKSSEADKLDWASKQAFLALGNALNGAKSLGFDSCPMGGFSAEEYIKILKLPKNIVPVALCPIGYAADTPRAKIRLPMNELFREI